MSSTDPFTAGAALDNFKLIERVGATVWKAVDVRSDRQVAVKVLTKGLPRDARRDAVVREVRVAAALYHAFLVSIQEVAVAGDALLMVMEWFDGEPMTSHVHGQPMNRAAFFRAAAQIVDAVKFLHTKGVVHGNLNGDSIMIARDGRVKVGGVNLVNLLRKEGRSTEYQQKGSDARTVAYMAPEQITGQQIDERADVFSLGSVLYEMSTGALPFSGRTAPDIARSIVDGKPGSPTAVNPAIDQAMMALLGKCLFKDPFKRAKELRLLAEDIARFDPEAAKFANELATRVVAAPAPAAASTKRHALLLVADLPQQNDASASARLQQVVGEAVFLFDGSILDPFAPRVVAEMPSVDSALEAGRKVEFDIAQEGAALPVRVILHAGEVEVKDGALAGDAVDKAVDILQQIPPQRLFISEAFIKNGRGNARLRDAGARAGVKLFEIVPPEPEVAPITTDELEQIAAEEAAAELAAKEAAAKARSKAKVRNLAVAAAAVFVLLAGGAVFMLRGRRPAAAAAAQSGSPKVVAGVLGPATAAAPRKVQVQPFAAEDPALADRANAIRLAAIEMLRSYPELRVVDAPAADVASFAATMRTVPTGPEIVAAPAGPAVPAPDAASAVQAVVGWVAAKVQMAPRPLPAPAAINAFTDAVAAGAAKDDAKTEAALRAAVKADPAFLAAQQMALSFFTLRGKDKEAIEAARQVVALEPGNLDAARALARASLRGGDVGEAFNAYGAILKQQQSDAEALNALGRYAVGAADAPRFQTALNRLRRVAPREVEVHAPDMLVATGRLEDAINPYYDIEVNVPDNPALALKIGRIAVLRRTIPIAELELAKLEKNDPQYGYHLLRAYMAAQRGDRTAAGKELDEARVGMRAGDDYWTSAAEVYALMADNSAVIAALENAAARKEPTSSYVLTNPLFTYLASDARFQKVRQAMAANQRDIQSALANVL